MSSFAISPSSGSEARASASSRFCSLTMILSFKSRISRMRAARLLLAAKSGALYASGEAKKFSISVSSAFIFLKSMI